MRLTEEQHSILEDARTVDLGEGLVFFITGDFGSGKTIIGIEIARIISSRRKIKNSAKMVKIVFTAPEFSAKHLLNFHQNTSYK